MVKWHAMDVAGVAELLLNMYLQSNKSTKENELPKY